MVYAAHGGFWLAASKAVGLVTSLALASAMAHFVPQYVFGNYRFVISGVAVISIFSLTGMGTAITQAVARGYEGALMAGTKEYLRWGVGTIVLTLGVAAYYLVNENQILAISFLIGGACMPLMTAASFFSQFISGKKQFEVHAWYEAIRSVFPALLLIVTVVITDNPVAIVAVYFISNTVVCLGLYWATLRRFRPNTSNDLETIPYGRHLSVMGALGKIAEHIDKILMFHYLGAQQLAMYAFALTPIGQLRLLNEIPARLATPKLSGRDLSELRLTLPRKVFLLVAIMGVITAIYIVCAPYLFRILFPQYAEAVFYTQLMALSLILVPGSMFSEALTAHMRKGELYISQIAIPLLKISLFAILVPLYGVLGAVITLICVQSLTFALHFILFLNASRDGTS